MERATISKLKDQLSAYLKRVQAGQTVIIFDRNRAIARIERIESHGRSDDRLVRLERAGLVRAGKGASSRKLLRAAVPKPKRSVVRALLDERGESR